MATPLTTPGEHDAQHKLAVAHRTDPHAHNLFGAFLRTGAIAETFPRHLGSANAGVLGSGRLSLVGIDLPINTVITSITFNAATTALSGGSNQWFGIFDLSRLMLRLTADDGATAWAASAEKTLALTSTWRTTYSGIHYLGINVTATTVPSLAAMTASVISLPTRAPGVAGNCDSGLTNPASCPSTAASFASIGGVPWAYVS